MLFPDLVSTRSTSLNLDHLAEEWFRANDFTEDASNPFLDPDTCEEILATAHARLQVDWSYGGWLEDRHHVLRGTYLDATNGYVHLGVDFNVPSGTRVAMCGEGQVIRIDTDFPEEGGWGTRILIRLSDRPIILIFAHLDPSVFVNVGDTVKNGQHLGVVGKAPENGGWFPHLHVQVADAVYIDGLLQSGQLSRMDGYGHANDLSVFTQRFFDPMNFVSF